MTRNWMKCAKDQNQKNIISVSRCETYITNNMSESVNNIFVCMESINGSIIYPNQVFSFNDIVGRRTREKIISG